MTNLIKCDPNKTEYLNVLVFNMITRINESKTLAKYISCTCKYKLDDKNVIQIKSGLMINVSVSYKKHHICEKDYFWNPATCSCKNGKYLANIIDNSVITCDEVIDAEAK